MKMSDFRRTAFVANTTTELSLGDCAADNVRPERRNSIFFPSSNRGGYKRIAVICGHADIQQVQRRKDWISIKKLIETNRENYLTVVLTTRSRST